MIDWDKAPEGTTHSVHDRKDGCFLGWVKWEEDQPVMFWSLNEWMKPIAGLSIQYNLVPRPAPSTETDDLLDMIRDMRYKAFEMGYREGFKAGKHNDVHPFNPMGAWADINQQEKQS